MSWTGSALLHPYGNLDVCYKFELTEYDTLLRKTEGHEKWYRFKGYEMRDNDVVKGWMREVGKKDYGA